MADVIRSTTASGVGPSQGSTVYESSRAVDEYLQFHFAKEVELVPLDCAIPSDSLQFPARLASLCDKHAPKSKPRRALDVGCAVGGASFELSRTFDEVIGIDFSNAFVAAANDMKQRGSRKYVTVVEGKLTECRNAQLPAGVFPERVSFAQGDACALPAVLGQFDAVLAANLLCRLPRPDAFLARTTSLLKPGGVLALVSPYSWLEEYTVPAQWMGGYVDAEGRAVHSADQVSQRLRELGLELVAEADMPFLIREHRRKYQWGCSHATVWRKLVQ